MKSTETIRYIKEDASKALHDSETKDIFKEEAPLFKEVEAKINKWDYTKLKSFCTLKKVMTRTQRLLLDWRNYSPKSSAKGIYPRYIRY